MPDEPEDANVTGDQHEVATATAVLAGHGIPAGARDFRLRQEFFRHGWDVRVREDGGAWTVRAVKPGRPDAVGRGPSEGDALRLALATALGADGAAGPS